MFWLYNTLLANTIHLLVGHPGGFHFLWLQISPSVYFAESSCTFMEWPIHFALFSQVSDSSIIWHIYNTWRVLYVCHGSTENIFRKESMTSQPYICTLPSLNISCEAFCLFSWHCAFLLIHFSHQNAFRKYECLHPVIPFSLAQTESCCRVQLSNKI